MNNSIANTTVISNFASIKRLDLLQQFNGKLYLSTHVLDEVKTGLHQGYTFYTDEVKWLLFAYLVAKTGLS